MDDDRPWCLAGAVEDDLALKLCRQLFIGGGRNVARLVGKRHLLALRQRMRRRHGKECQAKRHGDNPQPGDKADRGHQEDPDKCRREFNAIAQPYARFGPSSEAL
jgi:hypothetical protein